ncbi:MAG: metallopeptidase family protein [Candidatus Pacebacteria bacterium]|nr:metallopeptidase family protein [Candidatus Paceibacterota bacterium]
MRTILSDQEFEKLVKQGIDLIPENILKKLENIEICIEDKYLFNKSGSLVLGLYQGIPKIKRWGYGQVLPDKITIFKKSIEKIAKDQKDIKKIIAKTVYHEIAHHFGYSEKEVRKLEKKR